jgi:glutamine synthetase
VANKKRIRIEYVWLDGNEKLPQLRSKTRYINSGDILHIDEWNFDGGSTKQGSLKDSDRKLECVRTYKDPFHEGGLLALCEVRYHSGVPHETNTRTHLSHLTQTIEGILVGFEQEFTLLNPAGQEPLGLLLSPTEQGQYYCGAGAINVIGRFLLEEFEEACEKAGIELDGINAEVMPGQWEFQTKPQDPCKAGDDLWVARYILERLSENKPVIVSYNPKPHPNFNGAGCHTNFSTSLMRKEFTNIQFSSVMKVLEEDHKEYLHVCGDGYEKRMTGECETPRYDKFTWGVGDRGASVRIPEKVSRANAGYFEDRRPCANIDPYKVLYLLITSVKKSKFL